MFTGDYHTHTKYSDGRGSVADNAIAAKGKGLREIAVTDHGFRVMRKGRDKYLQTKADCVEAEKLTGIKVFAGVEADIVSTEGDVDIPEGLAESIDYILLGFHKFAPPRNASSFFKMYLRTYFNGLIPTGKKAIARNTRAVIAALDRVPVKVLTHVNHSLKVDVGAVAKACAERGVLVEINVKHRKDLRRDWQALVDSGADFVVNSDAHRPRDVGALEEAFREAVMHGIPKERIVNYCGD